MLGVFSLSVGVIGHLKTEVPLFRRGVYMIAGIILIKPGLLTDVIGAGLFVVLVLVHKYGRRVS
jgi:UPF0716 family protein affecting phage T7 exclusion